MDNIQAIFNNSLDRIYRLLSELDIDDHSFWEGCKANHPYVQESPITDNRVSVTLRCGMYNLPIGTYAQEDLEKKEALIQIAQDMFFTIEDVIIEGIV